ncbi:MAG: hypothetical protein A3J75_05045 [Acidobacteria bacterium RBG_16_68_9]|nr:MAG: hypothetical protein A3J75_05045 [Acidobacteria bacterium RBG_16_68_9]
MKTKDDVRIIHEAMIAAVDAVAKQHGFTCRKRNLRYDEIGFRFGVDAQWSGPGKNGEVVDGAKVEFELYAEMHGLKPDDYGRAFVRGMVKYVVCGIRPRGAKYNVLARRADGKVYKFMADDVARHLKAEVQK